MTDGLRDRAKHGGTPLLVKLAALSDDEWAELTHRMTKHFKREITARGLTLVAAAAVQAVDSLWDEPDPGTEDAAEGSIWMTHDEGAMAIALRGLRAALREAADG